LAGLTEMPSRADTMASPPTTDSLWSGWWPLRQNLAAADAERRVDTAITRARENIARARRISVILAGAAALLGAVAAWFAAEAGARHGRNPDQLSIWGARRTITNRTP
jgi:hypothetical protein